MRKSTETTLPKAHSASFNFTARIPRKGERDGGIYNGQCTNQLHMVFQLANTFQSNTLSTY